MHIIYGNKYKQQKTQKHQNTKQKKSGKENHITRILWISVFLLAGIFAVQTTHAFFHIQKQADASVGRKPITVVLDAGHGGEDGGAVAADGTQEKDVNLAITLQLQKMMEASGIKVVMIRDKDVAVNDEGLKTIRERKVSDIHNRLKKVNSQGDCFVISIHQNHFSDGKYYGTQTFYSQNKPESKVLAEYIQKSVVKNLQPQNKRQIKPAGKSIYLLWNAKVPAVIVECGFLSNAEEAKKLKDPDYQKKMAFSIWSGFHSYIEQSGVVIAPPAWYDNNIAK